jgi:glyoxylase-like metal-dependent hydrolase (beta-lactamase superfamily II)
MKVPTPFTVGDVNIYLIGTTLIDTGPKTADALQVVKTMDISAIENVLITHGHVDHHGLASYIKNVSECTVYVHKNDFKAVTDYKNELKQKSKKYGKFLEKSGVPTEEISIFYQYYKSFAEYGDSCACEVLPDTLETEEGEITVVHTPGHTAGSCCFLIDTVLYSGDTLLPTISTNPSIHAIFEKECGIKNYQKSLRRLLELDIECVYPGHRGIINDYRKRIHTILDEHTARRGKVIDSLFETPCTLVDIAQNVFGTVPVSETLLALAECYDHITILEKEGIAHIEEKEQYLVSLV